jgi:RNA polymerase sigma factor (sigma-70 family)
MRLALELLPPQDREVLVLREFDELPFDAIAARVGLSESGTRKRYHRALLLLARKTRALRAGEVDEALDD